MPIDAASSNLIGLGLGLDAGGTSTRWALADAQGRLVAQGQVAACSGAMMASASGRETLADLWAPPAQTVRPFGILGGICAGITGLDRDSVETMRRLAGQAMGLSVDRIELVSHGQDHRCLLLRATALVFHVDHDAAPDQGGQQANQNQPKEERWYRGQRLRPRFDRALDLSLCDH